MTPAEPAELFPVREAAELPAAPDFSRSLAMAMSRAIRQSGKSREAIAVAMTEILKAEGGVSVAMLNAYTSQARQKTHAISVTRFVAFVRATGCDWLWDHVLHYEGLTLLRADEAHYARAGLLEKRGRDLLAAAEAARRAAPAGERQGGNH